MTITKLTPEQADIMDFIPGLNGILLVSAGAGSGKTFLAEKITRSVKPKKGLYTAFNKAIVQSGIDRFKGTNMECKTLHALAYKYVQPGKIDDLTYTCIKENITYQKKAQIIKAIDMFFVSKDTDMYDFLEKYFKDDKHSKQLVDLCVRYIDKMVNKDISPTFNFLLKYFHLMLVEGTIDCSYDLVILDEINVAVDFKLINLDGVLELINDKPEKLELVLTGRYAHPELVKVADLVTEMLEIKHPYQQGIQARKGVDF